MNIILILSSLIIVQAGVLKAQQICDGLIVNHVYHNAEILKADLDKPYLLDVDRSTNTLFFSYNVQHEKDIFKSARIDLKTNEFKTIDDIANGFAQAVDQETHDVYIGGSDGLYKYNLTTHKSEFIGERGTNIWTVYFKGDLYYTEFPSQFLYKFSNGEATRFVDLQDSKVDLFIIDNDDDMFFTNATGLYQQKKGTDNATQCELPIMDYQGARGMTMDTTGRVYVCFQQGIFVVNKEKYVLEKVADTYDAFGVAFDKDNNMIYADATRLVRLKPNKDSNCGIAGEEQNENLENEK